MNLVAAVLVLASLTDLVRTQENFNHSDSLPSNDHPTNLCKSSCSFEGINLKDFPTAVNRLVKCAREEVLKAFDQAEEYKQIEFNKYVSFLKDNDTKNSSTPRTSCREIRALGDNSWESYLESLSDRMEKVVRTHSVIFRFYPQVEKTSEWSARRRHHYKKAFPMMVAGFMMMSSFLVPLGFQFMAMIGGKALLLSKMAFMMSMYQTYRRFYPELDYHHQFDHGPDVLPYPLHRSSEVTGTAGMTGAFAKARPDLYYKLKKG